MSVKSYKLHYKYESVNSIVVLWLGFCCVVCLYASHPCICFLQSRVLIRRYVSLCCSNSLVFLEGVTQNVGTLL